MAGHNKWSKVKRLKAVTDGRRSKVFSSLSREITLAAKTGGGDPDGNARLRTLLLKAREANLPAYSNGYEPQTSSNGGPWIVRVWGGEGLVPSPQSVGFQRGAIVGCVVAHVFNTWPPCMSAPPVVERLVRMQPAQSLSE